MNLHIVIVKERVINSVSKLKGLSPTFSCKKKKNGMGVITRYFSTNVKVEKKKKRKKVTPIALL